MDVNGVRLSNTVRVNKQLTKGNYEIPINTSTLVAGTYILKIITNEEARTEKLVIVR